MAQLHGRRIVIRQKTQQQTSLPANWTLLTPGEKALHRPQQEEMRSLVREYDDWCAEQKRLRLDMECPTHVHRSRAMQKMRAKSLADLVKMVERLEISPEKAS